jgi:hypothetical protein
MTGLTKDLRFSGAHGLCPLAPERLFALFVSQSNRRIYFNGSARRHQTRQ